MALLDNYLNLITSQHRDKPKYIDMVTTLLKPLDDVFETAVYFDDNFDLDLGVGAQLDILGDILGRDRNLHVEITDVYFIWDTEGLGWDQGLWKELYDPDTGITELPDDIYRRVLKVKVLANHWNGTIDDVREMFDTIFADLGTKVIIEDRQDMTMVVGFAGLQDAPIYRALLRLGELFAKPAGVRINYYFYSDLPGEKLFAWDADSDRLGGWDEGYWGNILQV